MNQNYIDNFPKIFEARLGAIDDLMIKKIKEKKIPEDFITDYCKLISSSYKTIAIGYFVLYDDLKESKENFYLGAKIQEILTNVMIKL